MSDRKTLQRDTVDKLHSKGCTIMTSNGQCVMTMPSGQKYTINTDSTMAASDFNAAMDEINKEE